MTTQPPTRDAASDLPPECRAFDAALADYLENTLDGDARAAADAHRASCARCDALVRDLDAIRAEAAELRPFAPTRDLWPGIAASIGTPIISLDHARRRNRSWISTRVAAALVLLSAGTTYVVARMTTTPATPGGHQVAVAPQQSPETAAPTGTPAAENPAATPAPTGTTTPTVTPVARKQSTEATYAQEIAGLHAVVEQRSTQLDPHTRAVIEHNLQVIDTAIAESRRALANDPHSAFLADQLDQALDTKLELMRTVALLPART
jgi:hypothetical protein